MLGLDKLSYWEHKSYFKGIDFLIVGAGIVGFSTALELRKRFPKARILVVDRGLLPSGASSKNAGFACFGSVTEILDDIHRFGEKKVWETVAQRWKGLRRLRDLVGDDALKLEINGSWDLLTHDEKGQYEEIVAQIPYLNQKLQEITGESAVYSVDDDFEQKFGMHGVFAAFHNRLEGQIDTSSMNDRFHQLVIENGIKVLFGIDIKDLADNRSNVQIVSSMGTFTASKAIVCTNGFGAQLFPNEDVKPARAQVLITKPIENLRIKGTFHYQQGYYYFRNIDGRILFGGGRNLAIEEETTTEFGNTELIINRLKELLRDVILPNTAFEIDQSWSGVMGVGHDKKPIIKRVSDNIYCGIRLGGMGVAIGSLVGEELAEQIKSDTI